MEDADDLFGSRPTKKVKTGYTAPKEVMDEIRQSGDHDEPMQKKSQSLSERESGLIIKREDIKFYYHLKEWILFKNKLQMLTKKDMEIL